MFQRKNSDLKKYKSASLYYQFYFLPMLVMLLLASYSIYVGVKILKTGFFVVLAGQQYIYEPVKSTCLRYRQYLQTKLSLLRL